jgi:hypothetical protein
VKEREAFEAKLFLFQRVSGGAGQAQQQVKHFALLGTEFEVAAGCRRNTGHSEWNTCRRFERWPLKRQPGQVLPCTDRR